MNGNAINKDDDGCNEVETIDMEMDTNTKGASKDGDGNTIVSGDHVTTISNSNNNVNDNVIEIDDSQEPDKTPSDVQPLRYNEMFKANKYLVEFVEKCLSLENSPGMLRIMNRTLFTLFVEADPEFKMSPKFDRLLVKIIKRLECDADHKFSHIKCLCDTLRLHKVKRRVNLITLETNLKGNGYREQIISGNGVKRTSNSDRDEKKLKADVIDLDDEQETVIIDDELIQNDVILIKNQNENSNKENNAFPHKPISNYNKFCNTNAIKETLPDDTDETMTDSNFNRTLISESMSNSNSQHMHYEIAPLDLEVPYTTEESSPDHIDKTMTASNSNRNLISELISKFNSENTVRRIVPITNATKESLSDHTHLIVSNSKRNVISEYVPDANSQHMVDLLKPLQLEVPNDIEESLPDGTDERMKVYNINRTPILESTLNSNSQHMDNQLTPKEFEVPVLGTDLLIESIEKQIAFNKTMINFLDELEVSVNSYKSPYVASERYRLKVVKLYKMLCHLTGEQAVKRREVRIQGTPGNPPGPARKLEKFLNDNIGKDGEPPFPDLVDVLKCVAMANRDDNIGWGPMRVLEEAHSLFLKCGRALQKRRKEREWRDLMSHVKGEFRDPADDDPELLARLELNRRVAIQKEEEVFNRYTEMQNMAANNYSHNDLQVNVTHPSDTSDDEDENVASEIEHNTTDAGSSTAEADVVDLTNEIQVKCKQEPEDITALLAELGDNYTATIIDIEDPFLVIDISSDSESDDETSPSGSKDDNVTS